MRVVVATGNMDVPGGAESYVLTISEHLARLGHEVTIAARSLGGPADLARERGLEVSGSVETLPPEADGVLSLDRALAIELAERYPRAARAYVIHNLDDQYMPPPVPDVVAASIAPSDRLAAVAEGSVGVGKVVRLRQPVDLRRFSPRGTAADPPVKALVLSNYRDLPRERFSELQRAWAGAGLDWETVGSASARAEVAEVIGDADIVVGYGRSILEAMACGRPAYVHEHAGSAGWVTADSYPAIEAGGFSGVGVRPPPDAGRLRLDLDAYSPELGRVNQDLARANHDARTHAAELADLLARLRPAPAGFDRSAMLALRNLAEAQLRAETAVDRYRVRLQETSAEEREVRRSLEAATDWARRLERSIDEITGTRRYRIGAALARPLDAWRRHRRES